MLEIATLNSTNTPTEHAVAFEWKVKEEGEKFVCVLRYRK
jgi:hypothetical protein